MNTLIILGIFIIFYLFVFFFPLKENPRLAQGIALFSLIVLLFILYDEAIKFREENKTEYKINLLNQTEVEINGKIIEFGSIEKHIQNDNE